MAVRKTAFAFMLLIWFSLIGQAGAAGEDCSITLTFSYRGSAVSGGSVTLYCVTGLSENDAPQTAQALAADTAALTGETKSIHQGAVFFDKLTPGRYLLVQEKNLPGFLPISPFLITLPMKQNDVVFHDVHAAPKLAPCPSPPETGQSRWPFILFGVSGMVLTLAGIGHWTAISKKCRLR